MPARQHRVAQVTQLASQQIVVTCEHASNALPRGVGKLGVSAATLRSHVAWDPGSRELASIIAHRLGAAQFAGRYTRLLVDLNRSRGSRHLIPQQRFGYNIPGNRLERKEREERIAKYYTPYRDAVEAAVRRRVDEEGICLHLSVHTFAPKLDGEVRNADVGILYDPQRRKERRFAVRLRDALDMAGVPTRLNYPYQGTADGFTTYLRKQLPKTKYLGIEIEVNQRTLSSDRAVWRMGRLITETVAEAFEV